MDAQIGDWILPIGHSFADRAIQDLTFGKVNHAAIVYDKDTVLETDGSWFKARFWTIHEYDVDTYFLIRPTFVNDYAKIQELCNKYKGSIYSYWDIVTQGLFFWLHPKIREKLVSLLGTRKFMICSELVARITYEATNYGQLKNYGGMNPQDLLELALNNPTDFLIERKQKA